MNPGITEETGETARSVVDALKQQPLILLTLLINILFMSFLFFNISENNKHESELTKELIQLATACAGSK